MRVCVYTYVYIYIYIYTHTIHMCVYLSLSLYIYIYISTYILLWFMLAALAPISLLDPPFRSPLSLGPVSAPLGYNNT